jgi:hypothetical protein
MTPTPIDTQITPEMSKSMPKNEVAPISEETEVASLASVGDEVNPLTPHADDSNSDASSADDIESGIVKKSSNNSTIRRRSVQKKPHRGFGRRASAEYLPKSTDLMWENIDYTVKVKDSKNNAKMNKVILKHVSGYAHAGDVLALMGPSGVSEIHINV